MRNLMTLVFILVLSLTINSPTAYGCGDYRQPPSLGTLLRTNWIVVAQCSKVDTKLEGEHKWKKTTVTFDIVSVVRGQINQKQLKIDYSDWSLQRRIPKIDSHQILFLDSYSKGAAKMKATACKCSGYSTNSFTFYPKYHSWSADNFTLGDINKLKTFIISIDKKIAEIKSKKNKNRIYDDDLVNAFFPACKGCKSNKHITWVTKFVENGVTWEYFCATCIKRWDSALFSFHKDKDRSAPDCKKCKKTGKVVPIVHSDFWGKEVSKKMNQLKKDKKIITGWGGIGMKSPRWYCFTCNKNVIN